MKTKMHQVNNNMNIFSNKENINPLLNYTPNKPELKKNTKENFFDEMDQLLNADFWQKNANRTNYPQKLNSTTSTNNSFNKNPFGINVINDNKGINKMSNFESLMNMMNNVDNIGKSKGLFNLLNTEISLSIPFVFKAMSYISLVESLNWVDCIYKLEANNLS